MVAFGTLHAFVFVASTGNALSFGSFLGRSAGGRVTSVSPRLQQTTVLNNIWSNSQAVEDYKDYLDGKEIVVTKDGDAVIVVGKSERERNLAKCFAKLNPRGLDATLELGEKIPLEHPRVPGLTDFPVYMCVSASELAAAIDESCPDEKRDDLVFLSDGFLEPILKARGLCRKENTQATLWVSVGDKGKMYDERTSMV